MASAIREHLGKKEPELRRFVAGRPLLGLFEPAPRWPPSDFSVEDFLRRGLQRLLFLAVFAAALALGVASLWLRLHPWVRLCLATAPLLYGGYRQARPRAAAALSPTCDGGAEVTEWQSKGFFDPSTPGGVQRRRLFAEATCESAEAGAATRFNEHVRGATGIAVYGCGVLAAAHVGGLRALERHGLQYQNLRTLSGVSAGAVVVAMVAVGCEAEELFRLIQALPLVDLAKPHLGSVLRVAGNLLQDVLRKTLGDAAANALEPLAGGHGPGLNTGRALEEMVGSALESKCGDAGITLGGVERRFGKRLVIIVCELDSGKEVHLTPETHPSLPVRVAVRMSMGVPGLMEPFKYDGHVYCDGGMCNDFPLNAVLGEEVRIGLMVRPVDWIEYHLGGVEGVLARLGVGGPEGAEAPACLAPLARGRRGKGLWPVKSLLDLMLASVNVMMDANLMLQIRLATAARNLGEADRDISELAPEVLALCGGRLDPFDFFLSEDRHRDLYHSGQLCVHLHADHVDPGSGVLRAEDKLKLLLFMLSLDYPR